jgi:queuine tRNA-ribosyltransferase
MLATIHNLHYYLNLMQEVRDALDAGDFAGFVARFKGDRARGFELFLPSTTHNSIEVSK